MSYVFCLLDVRLSAGAVGSRRYSPGRRRHAHILLCEAGGLRDTPTWTNENKDTLPKCRLYWSFLFWGVVAIL
jgi:hypothetical protein